MEGQNGWLNEHFGKRLHFLDDAIYRMQLTGREHDIVNIVIRQTIGYGREAVKIPLSHFAERTGMERRHCSRTLHRLIERRIILAEGYTPSREVVTYGMNPRVEQWVAPVPKGGNSEN
jgi:phage replication O-like protein O